MVSPSLLRPGRDNSARTKMLITRLFHKSTLPSQNYRPLDIRPGNSAAADLRYSRAAYPGPRTTHQRKPGHLKQLLQALCEKSVDCAVQASDRGKILMGQTSANYRRLQQRQCCEFPRYADCEVFLSSASCLRTRSTVRIRIQSIVYGMVRFRITAASPPIAN